MKLQTGIKLSLLLCIMIATPVMAHPGRTNADGCHTNRKTGEYHCHGSKSRRVDYYGQDKQSDNKTTAAPAKKTKPYSTKKEIGMSKAKTGSVRRDKGLGDSRPDPVAPPPDVQVQCINSKNFNAYWEAVTRRCLDRSTGRELVIP
ncbi:DUF1283 domain-containing protein [Serratia ficaria]|uniref:DUF1283 domain-containing protein n=1 Tax=Serratia TaxID=613 RepID=UPI0013ED5D9D|nr:MULTISPECIES: DUF1283 domain-containing protein [Serratia]MEE4484095.1 DUF1283 domain-containing protein [Serratia ficaria]